MGIPIASTVVVFETILTGNARWKLMASTGVNRDGPEDIPELDVHLEDGVWKLSSPEGWIKSDAAVDVMEFR